MANKTTLHKLTLMVRTDKPCSKASALYLARNYFHGEQYCDYSETPEEVEVIKISSIKP